MKQLFRQDDISQQMMVKVFLFGISVILAYVFYLVYVKNCYKQVQGRLLPDAKKVRLIFKPKAKTNRGNYWYLLINMLLLWLFFAIDDGTEGVFFVLNCLVTTVWFLIWLGYPMGGLYTKGHVSLEKMELKSD